MTAANVVCGLLTSLLLALSVNAAGEPARLEGQAGPHSFRLEVLVPAAGRDVQADLAAAARALDEGWRTLSRDGADSEPAGVNALAGQRSGRLSRAGYDLVLRSLDWKDRTRGAVDLLAGPLRRYAEARPAGEAGAAPDSVLALVHEGGTYFVDLGVLLRDPGMELDLDPLLDGVLADRALENLRTGGHKGLRVEVGGVWSQGGGEAWPRILASEWLGPMGTLELNNGALAATVWHNGLVDARDGTRPHAQRMAWALAPTGEAARGWANALFLLGGEGLALLKEQGGVQGAVLDLTPGGWGWTASAGFPLAAPAGVMNGTAGRNP